MSFPRSCTFCLLLVLSIFSVVARQQTLAQEGTPAATNAPSAENSKPQVSPEAQVAARRGIEYLEKKEYKKAIEIFKLAARMQPQEAQLRHLLAVAYMQDKQLGPAWLQIRQAVRLAPNYAAAVRTFESMWQAFASRGIFGCGRSSEEVLKLIGKPDKMIPGANAETEFWVYGLKQVHFTNGRLSAIVDPRGLDKALADTKFKLEHEFDDQTRWRLAFRSVNQIQSLTEYVPAGESPLDWSEMYMIQRLHHFAKKQTPSTMMKNLEQNLKKSNPDVEFVVLAEREAEVMFHWRDAGSKLKKRKPQHEIVRLMTDGRDIHRLAYAQHVAQIPAEMATNWAAILQKAKLVPIQPSTEPSE